MPSNHQNRWCSSWRKRRQARLAEKNDSKGKLEKGQDKLGEKKTKQDFLQKALSETIGYIPGGGENTAGLVCEAHAESPSRFQKRLITKKQNREDMGRKWKLSQGCAVEQCEEEDILEKKLDRITEEKKLAEKDRLLRPEREEREQLGNEVMCTRKAQVQESLQKRKRTGRRCYRTGSHK